MARLSALHASAAADMARAAAELARQAKDRAPGIAERLEIRRRLHGEHPALEVP